MRNENIIIRNVRNVCSKFVVNVKVKCYRMIRSRNKNAFIMAGCLFMYVVNQQRSPFYVVGWLCLRQKSDSQNSWARKRERASERKWTYAQAINTYYIRFMWKTIKWCQCARENRAWVWCVVWCGAVFLLPLPMPLLGPVCSEWKCTTF